MSLWRHHGCEEKGSGSCWLQVVVAQTESSHCELESRRGWFECMYLAQIYSYPPPNNCQLTTANHVFMVCSGILQNSCCSKETRRWIVGGTQRLKIKVATTCELFLRGVLTLGCSNWPGAQDRPGQGCLCKTLHCLWQDLLVIQGRWLPSRLPELSRIGFYRSRSEKPPLSTRPFVVLVVGSLIQKAFKIWR